MDEELKFYEAFGKNSIFGSFSWNPIRIYRSMKDIGKRLAEKKIVGNMKGEGLKTGGILIFGADGEPKYMYKEETGVPIDEDIFLEAVNQVRNGQSSTVKVEL